MSNRLADSTSPYLLQHRDNPVDWYPWGEEALALAKAEDRPILLSIGYAACHWCHVMERESFENETTAAFMNENFVPIKVDREERPDVDAIYMEFVQTITGHGGWPLTVFLDPDAVPFHGGTYFPPEDRPGMFSFMTVMEAVLKAFREQRDQLREQAPRVRDQLEAIAAISARGDELNPELTAELTGRLVESIDPDNGGFGGAPKFPPASTLDFLNGRGESAPVELTLDRMAAGGIYDQIGGGFARYSVDGSWQVPHFEKMLYDNALLARSYLRGFQNLGHQRYRRICEETLDWALSEMRDPAGGFYASLDADSEGEEGIFYTWTPEELKTALGGRADLAMETWGVTEGGNFEGRNVLHLPERRPPDDLDGEVLAMKEKLLEIRSQRIRPGLDDKVLCSWNALMISALAEAGAVLGRPDYIEAANECAEFIWTKMRDSQGTLRRTYRNGEARLNAYLEDHAFLLEALLDLYQATFDTAIFNRAIGVAETMIDRFADTVRGGFFTTSHDHEALIARRKDVGDHPIPAGSSSAALGMLRLAALTGERRYFREGEAVVKQLAVATGRQPDAFGHLLQAMDLYLDGDGELAFTTPARKGGQADPVTGAANPSADETSPAVAAADLIAAARSRFRPRLVIAAGPEGASTPPLLAGRTLVDGKAAAYLCENFSCRAPVTDPEALRKELDALSS